MGRPVVLSNGQLFVGLDESGLVHDFYYPYVGLENLTNARSSQHKIGLWVDGEFKWTDDGTWHVEVDFEADALVSSIHLRSSELQVSLHLQDFVDPKHNTLIRHITLTNDADHERDIRLFMHQVFQISRAGRADTAIYVPDDHYILDYKGRYCLLIAGRFADGGDFDQYAVGNYGIEGKAGTFLDAIDGELSGNAVEHGGVDSVIRFQKQLGAGVQTKIDYWIIAASSQTDVQQLHREYKAAPLSERLEAARTHWQQWLDGPLPLPDFHRRSLQHSLLVIKAHCDDRGSVLASGDSSIFNYGRDYYCYCWPRDAAYALWPLIRLGHFDEARQFFDFARDTLHPDGYLMHKYQPDRAIGSTWHPLVHGRHTELAIQEDETASVVFMIGEYLEANVADQGLVQSLYHSFVTPAADFMVRFIDENTGLPHASYDLWEEKFLTTTYSVCTVIAALQTAAKLATAYEEPDKASKWGKAADNISHCLGLLYHPDGYFRKGFLLNQDTGELQYDDTLDISNLYGPFMYGGLPLDDERLVSTARHVEERLLNSSPSGGVLRYEHDNYFLIKRQYKGNPWIVSTLWLAQYHAATGQTAKAQPLLDWALQHELPSGVLSEQFDPETGTPLGVTPLVWSHAELVNTLLDLAPKPKG